MNNSEFIHLLRIMLENQKTINKYLYKICQ